jgi:D-lactate dehydrogenase (cytochrome)
VPDVQKPEGGSIKHDVSVPVGLVATFIDRATAAVEAMVPGVRVVAFGHVGDGNMHFNLSQPVGADTAAFLARWTEVNAAVHAIAVEMDGSFSAEHGIGQLKLKDMRRFKDPVEVELMRRIKRAFDPADLLNPGKVLPSADA